MENQFSMENVLKTFGKINQAIYGINPFEEKEETSSCCDAEIINGRCFNCKDNCK